MPTGGDLSKYSQSDWGRESTAKGAMYELCRESGEPHDMAQRHATAGARQLAEDLGGERGARPEGSFGGAGTPRTADGRCSRRTPWPWEEQDEPVAGEDGGPPSEERGEAGAAG